MLVSIFKLKIIIVAKYAPDLKKTIQSEFLKALSNEKKIEEVKFYSS
jgi:hypothetical protein